MRRRRFFLFMGGDASPTNSVLKRINCAVQPMVGPSEARLLRGEALAAYPAGGGAEPHQLIDKGVWNDYIEVLRV